MKKGTLSGILALIVMITVLLEVTLPGFRAIWPSVVALVLVFSTRNVLLGLLGGAVVGSIFVTGGRVWVVPLDLVENHLLPNFQSSWKSGAIIFTLLLGGFVHLLERGGTLQSLLSRLLHGRSARKLETGAGLFGLVCFFDGLANSLMVGRIFQPLAKANGVPKVRLAYIVDTTSAAVACLAFISTWIAYQLAMIREGFLLAGHEEIAQPYQLFFQSLPHNFYAWFALIVMGLVIWKQWDIGPMKQFRENTRSEADDVIKGIHVEGGIWRAWIPLSILLGIVFTGIYADGTGKMSQAIFPLTWEKLALSFAEANVPAILVAASGLAALVAWILFPVKVLAKGESAGGMFIDGMLQMFKPVLILVMAWMLSSTLNELQAANYLGELLGGRIHPSIFPTSVFLIGSLVAFTTGTSWGTMGLLMPLAIPLTFSISGGDIGLAMNMVPVVIGAVFSGAVFGDHCSPISDTTIVSSIACGVDPMDHVRTQMPYALIAALGAAIVGFPLSGLSNGSTSLAIASIALFFIILLLLEHIFSRTQSKA